MDKLKVLVVDDEPLVSETILSLLEWENEGFCYPKVAYNGKEALKIFERERPDIVITDIYMPVIDGIELCRQILKLDKQANIIILTVSKEFECVKEALELGVFSYLLKHELTTENLRENLQKIRKNRKQKFKLKKAIIRSFFEQLFCENSADTEELRNYGYSRDNIRIAFLLILSGEVVSINTGNRKEKRDFGNDLRAELGEYSSLYLTRYEHQYIISEIGKTESELGDAEEFGRSFAKELEERDGCAIFLFCRPCGMKEAKKAFSEMQQILDNKVFMPKNRLLAREDYVVLNNDMSVKTDEYLKELKELFFDPAKDQSKIIKTINEMFDVIRKNYDLKSLTKACRSLNEYLEIGRKNMGILPLSSEKNIEKICWYDIEEMRACFLTSLEEFSSRRKETNMNSKRIREILNYIQEHYSEDLSADSVAGVFNISSVYLHQQFKKEVGDTFLNYLVKVRMEHAKTLLQHSNYKINVVAEKVGYHSSQYFSQIFRKYEGCTPLEFRELR